MPKKGYKQTEEHKEKNRLANSGENNGMYGKNRSGKNNPMYGVHRFGKDNPMWHKKHSEKTILKQREAQQGCKNYQWKGEKFQTKEGYWTIWIRGKRVSQARYIAEQCLQRKLTKEECVHHINEDKSDDRPENLYVFPTNSAHITYHNLKTKPILISNII